MRAQAPKFFLSHKVTPTALHILSLLVSLTADVGTAAIRVPKLQGGDVGALVADERQVLSATRAAISDAILQP